MEHNILMMRSRILTNATSSPRYPQCNGEAERPVRIVKDITSKSEDYYLGLLACRSTPLHNGLSPAELMTSRNLGTTVPVLLSMLEEQVDAEHKENC